MSRSLLAENRPFRLFWIGQTTSNLGDAFGFVAMPLLVLETTKSVVDMGRVTAVAVAGQLITAIISGPIVDRFHRWRLMIACDAVRTLLFAMFPVLAVFGVQSLGVICLLAGLTAIASNLFSVAYMAAIPNLVEPGDVASANGQLQASQALTYVVGTALAGVVCSRVGPSWALGVDAISFVASAVTLWRIEFRRARAVREGHGPGVLSELWSGLVFLAHQRVLRSLLVFQTGIALLGSIGTGAAVIDLIVFRLRSDFHQSGAVVGATLAVASIGAVFGALGVARFRRHLGLGAVTVTGTAAQALGLLSAGLGGGSLAVTIGGALWSFGLTFRAVGATSLRQLLTPDRLLGRVVAAAWVPIFSAAAVGALGLTRLAARVGSGPALATAGAMLAVLSAFGALSLLARGGVSAPSGGGVTVGGAEQPPL